MVGVWDSAVKEFKTMMETLKPSMILVYGEVFPFMDGANIERIEKFTEKRWGNK